MRRLCLAFALGDAGQGKSIMHVMIKLSAAALMLAASPGFAQATMGGATSTPEGLNDASGKPLYTFARDTTPGKSACNGDCAKAWPPLAATASDKDSGDCVSLITVTRSSSPGPSRFSLRFLENKVRLKIRIFNVPPELEAVCSAKAVNDGRPCGLK
jgi:Uncharacterized protein conserved in bacteria